MAQKVVGNPIKLTTETALINKQSHQDEKRNDRQAIALRRVNNQATHHGDRAAKARFMPITEHTHQAHGEGYWKPQ